MIKGDRVLYVGDDIRLKGEEGTIIETKFPRYRVQFGTPNDKFWVRQKNIIPVVEDGEKSNPIIPAHYHKGKIDTISFCNENFNTDEMRGAYKFNVIKYIQRYRDKNGVEDLKKAQAYLERLIKLEESNETN